MKKTFVTLGMAAVLSVASSLTAFAGWEQMGAAWKYQNTDGVYLANTWAWIDGNNDGIAESYCFDGNGNLYVNVRTPDQYVVNENGAWTVNGVVQTMVVGGEQDTQADPQQKKHTSTQADPNDGFAEHRDEILARQDEKVRQPGAKAPDYDVDEPLQGIAWN